jgi:hypothetical protein
MFKLSTRLYHEVGIFVKCQKMSDFFRMMNIEWKSDIICEALNRELDAKCFGLSHKHTTILIHRFQRHFCSILANIAILYSDLAHSVYFRICNSSSIDLPFTFLVCFKTSFSQIPIPNSVVARFHNIRQQPTRNNQFGQILRFDDQTLRLIRLLQFNRHRRSFPNRTRSLYQMQQHIFSIWWVQSPLRQFNRYRKLLLWWSNDLRALVLQWIISAFIYFPWDLQQFFDSCHPLREFISVLPWPHHQSFIRKYLLRRFRYFDNLISGQYLERKQNRLIWPRFSQKSKNTVSFNEHHLERAKTVRLQQNFLEHFEKTVWIK